MAEETDLAKFKQTLTEIGVEFNESTINSDTFIEIDVDSSYVDKINFQFDKDKFLQIFLV